MIPIPIIIPSSGDAIELTGWLAVAFLCSLVLLPVFMLWLIVRIIGD